MKRAIVTGVSRGIGRAITEMLLAEGWYVLGVSRTQPSEWQGFNWLRCDVGDFGLLEDGLKSFPVDTVDALIHCAGVRGPYGAFADVDPSAWSDAIQTNLMGTASAVRACLPALKRSDDPRVLLFSGGGAFGPAPGYSAYAASKGAVVSLMEALASELSGQVAVNCVAPGFIATDIHRGTPHEGQDDGGAMATAVACVRHLLGPEARGLTGKTISAVWDDWENVDQTTVDGLNASEQGTRTRHTIRCVRALARRPALVAI